MGAKYIDIYHCTCGHNVRTCDQALDIIHGHISRHQSYQIVFGLGPGPGAHARRASLGLAQALQDSEPSTRGLAVRSLAWHETPGATELIQPLLKDSDLEVVYRSLQALEDLDPEGTKSLEILETLQDSRDPRVARKAQRLLSQQP